MAVPPSQINQQLVDIAAMEDAFEQASCQPQDPFVKYPTPDTGTPPMINFNIPQTTAFTTYGKLVKYIDPTWFKDFTKKVPTYNFFDYVKTLTPNAVQQLFNPNVAAAPAVLGQFVPYASAPHAGTTLATAGHNYAANAGPKVSASAMQPQMVQALPQQLTFSPIASFAQQGIRGLYSHRIMNGGAIVRYVAQPPVPVPRIMVIEEYTTASYLGDYGAGRVVKTFTLLPGEKTTISIRTYKDQSGTSSASDNMLDSFSDSSATQLDNMMQQETGLSDSSSATKGGNDTSYNTYSDSKNSSSAWNISAKINIADVVDIGGGYGQSKSDTSTTAGGFANTTNYSNSATRASNINTLTSALDKSVQESNANRQIDVNHTTTSTADSGEEDATVREIQNVNLSRVLNFTFRQLLQQYTTITYLSGLKFGYTNGYPETGAIVDLSALPNMLTDIIMPGNDPVSGNPYIDEVMCLLLKPYCSVLNFNDEPKQLIEAITNTIGGCLTPYLPSCTTETETIWRIKKGLKDYYPTEDAAKYTVPGIILDVRNQTLYTDSLIGDALMGAGEALDCFNQKAQDASTMADYIRNLQSMQRLEDSIRVAANDALVNTQQLAMGEQQMDVTTQKEAVIQALIDAGDAVTTATLYKKVFSDCCDVPQNTDCGGGCGCS